MQPTGAFNSKQLLSTGHFEGVEVDYRRVSVHGPAGPLRHVLTFSASCACSDMLALPAPACPAASLHGRLNNVSVCACAPAPPPQRNEMGVRAVVITGVVRGGLIQCNCNA